MPKNAFKNPNHIVATKDNFCKQRFQQVEVSLEETELRIQELKSGCNSVDTFWDTFEIILEGRLRVKSYSVLLSNLWRVFFFFFLLREKSWIGKWRLWEKKESNRERDKIQVNEGYEFKEGEGDEI